MTTTKKESPGCSPSPLSEQPAYAGCALSERERSEAQLPAQAQRSEASYYSARAPYSKHLEARAATDKGFTAITNETLELALELGIQKDLWLWLVLHRAYSTDKRTGELTVRPMTYAELEHLTGKAKKTLENAIKRLEAQGFLEVVAQRKMRAPGNSGQEGNIYLLNYRRPQKESELVEVSIEAPATPEQLEAELTTRSTPTSNPGTMSLEAEIVTGSAHLRAISSSYLDTEKRTAPALKLTSISSPKMATPPAKNGELVISLKDLSTDLLSASAKKKTAKASSSQLEAIGKHLSKLCSRSAALEHYGLKDLSELSSAQANELIQATKDPESSKLARELRASSQRIEEKQRALREALDREAEQARQLEQETAFEGYLLATYGRHLSEQEKTARAALKRKALRKDTLGLTLEALESDYLLSPEERSEQLKELIAKS